MYFMTSKMNNELGFWMLCKSKTLRAAKREASNYYRDGYVQAVIVIATGDDITSRRKEVASKLNNGKGSWVDSL